VIYAHIQALTGDNTDDLMVQEDQSRSSASTHALSPGKFWQRNEIFSAAAPLIDAWTVRAGGVDAFPTMRHSRGLIRTCMHDDSHLRSLVYEPGACNGKTGTE
jgi:hypothetical protein